MLLDQDKGFEEMDKAATVDIYNSSSSNQLFLLKDEMLSQANFLRDRVVFSIDNKKD